MIRAVLLTVLAAALSGCTFFHLTQEDAFIDGEGNILTVRYGEFSKPYTYEMVSPMNGAVVEYTSNKVAEMILPDSGKHLMCYLCQNKWDPNATAYMTRDRKWLYLTWGYDVKLWLIKEDASDYYLVFEGQLFMMGDDEGEGGR